MKKRQNVFVKRSSESLAMLEASNKIPFVLAKMYKPFSDGEDKAKPCLNYITKLVCDTGIESNVNDIVLLEHH